MYQDQYTGQIPGSTAAYQLAAGKFYPRGLTAKAIKVFYNEWKERFGDEDLKVHKALNSVRIIWIDSVTFKSACGEKNLFGETSHLQDYVKVSIPEKNKNIWATALAHKLVHVANWAVNGHFDYDHTGPKYSGWTQEHNTLINNVNFKMRAVEKEFNEENKHLWEADEN